MMIGLFRSSTHVGLVELLMVGLLVCHATWADDGTQSAAESGEDRVMNMALWLPIFSGFSPRDARVAARMWVEKWGKTSGVFDRAEAHAFNDLSRLDQDLVQESWDVVMLPVEEYLHVGEQRGLTPDYTIVRGGKPGDVYVLLVRSDAGIDELSDLKGKSMTFSTEHNHRNAVVWLDGLLAESNLPPLSVLAELTEGERKGARVILPVFFGQTDGCVVSLSEFETMAKLNPQLKRQLKVLATSPRVITIVFSVSPNVSELQRKALNESLLRLHEDKEYRQILLLHKVEGLAPIDRQILESTRRMYDLYNRCTNAVIGRGKEPK